MRTTYKPDYAKAEKAAQELLQLNGVNKLPVKVKKLAKDFSNLKIKKYSWFAKKWGLSFEDVCNMADSNEGCCIYFKSTGEYLILYNENVNNIGRIRWTLAHELGHYILKHNELTDKAILSRSSLSDEEYEIFESEANCFARELLTPPPVIRAINIANPMFISNIGKISLEAANNVNEFIKIGAQIGIKYPNNNPIIKLFSNFIYLVKYAKWCRNCNHSFSKSNAVYCPVCGESTLINNSLFYKERSYMQYHGIQLNEIGRAVECPKCGNENVKGKYCNICNTYLFNKCSGFIEGDPNFQNRDVLWHEYDGGCGKILEGNARYCHECGSTSTFYEDGLLTYWQTEKEAQNEAAATVLTDEDLPF